MRPASVDSVNNVLVNMLLLHKIDDYLRKCKKQSEDAFQTLIRLV